MSRWRRREPRQHHRFQRHRRHDRDLSYFTKLGPAGTLTAAAFHKGAAAHDADDRIIYNPVSVNVFYDADGNGPGAAVFFAHISAGLLVTQADFFVVS